MDSAVRKAAKSFLLVVRQLKPKTDFDKKNLHKIVGLKEPYFWPNIATNLSKTMILP